MKDKPPKRTERKRQRNRTEILESARHQIRENGLGQFSLASVADAVGLTKPALYYYFKNREALVFEVLLEEWTRSAQAVADAVEKTDTGAGALRALNASYVGYFADDLPLFDLVQHGVQQMDVKAMLVPEQIQRIRPLNDLLYGGTERRLRADADAGLITLVDDPRRLAFIAHAMAIGVLSIKSMVDQAGDPLIHSDAELLHTLGALLDAGAERTT